MHVLFVHKNFPAQFGHIAARLVKQGHQATFVSETAPGTVAGIRKIHYRVQGGATPQTHYCSRTFENATWHAAAVYEALKPDAAAIQPDLIVGHSGFGSTVFLPELFPDTPIVNYFEYYYRPHGSDLDFRADRTRSAWDFLRSRTRNAMMLLDLETCQAGSTPTLYQRSLFPATYTAKLRVIHDGIPTDFWQRRTVTDRQIGGRVLGPDTRVVTYVSRGMETMRGFDIFMQVAKRIYEAYPDVCFLVVGSDRVCYGDDLDVAKAHGFSTYKEYVLAQDTYDLDRILFLGQVEPDELVRIFSLSDLHIYLTAPFVLSWSLLDAMSCGCTILASDTAPVREVLRDGENGLLRGFFDVEGLTTAALQVLEDPKAYRSLGVAAAASIRERYDLATTLSITLDYYQEVIATHRT